VAVRQLAPEAEMSQTVTALLDAIETGRPIPDGIYAESAEVDATVPGWRFTLRGVDAIRAKFATWYADPGRFEELDRIAVPGGEIVRFSLTWTEHGVPFAAHQSHLIQFGETGAIERQWVFCGGRWDAALLARMEEAERVRA